ncbi:MAG: FAD/NAD(P)-binding protein [Alphaproteobacteria bacterium]|nr:FAD/NAD(P)-binding protein [Alphaproteobacteria bacterium]
MKIVIVGAGYSGSMAAVEAARAVANAEVTLIDRRGTFAAGAAYSTTNASHLLNVRARGMSAFADEPDHFARWVEAAGLGGPDTFVPRRDYRRYLEGVLAGAAVARVPGEAVAVEDRTLVLADGARIASDALVLAGGNYGGRLPARIAVPTVDDPWSAEGLAAIAGLARQEKDVLLVGTGLTMVDVALSLVDAGFEGRMVAVSRRGLLPRPHEEPASPPAEIEPPARLGALVRAVRNMEAPWRAAVDSLRPHTQALWQGLSLAEKRRFLRHLRPWWDVHRHRIAPPVARRIEALIAMGRLEVLAGRLRGGEGGAITVAVRGGGTRPFDIAGAVNCTGPEGAIARVEDKLIRQLLASGRARPDALGIGLDVDAGNRVIGADGAPSPGLYAVGPLTRGALWEIVAVPDIRHQVRDLARALDRESRA